VGQLKKCTGCKKDKFLNNFYKHENTKDGLRSCCKICDLISAKIRRKANLEKYKLTNRVFRIVNYEKLKKQRKKTYWASPNFIFEEDKMGHIKRQCVTCKKKKFLKEFNKNTKCKYGKDFYCRVCSTARQKAKYNANPEKYRAQKREFDALNPGRSKALRRARHATNPQKKLLSSAKQRAKNKNLPLNIEEKDIFIPERCPVCDCKLVLAKGGAQPNSSSLDRIIPKLGYVKNNIIVICRRCNTIKLDATPEELMRLGEFVKKIIKEKKLDESP